MLKPLIKIYSEQICLMHNIYDKEWNVAFREAA